MDELEFRVKKEFVLLYTKDNFLKTFHNRIIQSIKDNKFKIIEKKNVKYVIHQEKEMLLPIPILPKLGKLDLKKIKESKYMIS